MFNLDEILDKAAVIPVIPLANVIPDQQPLHNGEEANRLKIKEIKEKYKDFDQFLNLRPVDDNSLRS